MRFRIKYKLNITLADNDRITPKKLFEDNPDKLVGKASSITGTKEYIKKKLCEKIDSLTDELQIWFYGGEE
jgi:hypothetical protein